MVDGRAELIDSQLPRRVQEKMRERLGRLSDEASDAVTVAASLGRTFTFDELARTLGRPASDLLAPVGELLEANLLVERDEKLAFWHDITREAVRASVPVTARRALDRQAAGVLLEAGALPVEVAVQLAASAEPGDEVAIDDAARCRKGTGHDRPGDRRAVRPARARDRAGSPSADAGRSSARRRSRCTSPATASEAIAFADRALRETLPARAGGRSPPQHRRHVRDLAGDPDRRRAPRPEPPRPLRRRYAPATSPASSTTSSPPVASTRRARCSRRRAQRSSRPTMPARRSRSGSPRARSSTPTTGSARRSS